MKKIIREENLIKGNYYVGRFDTRRVIFLYSGNLSNKNHYIDANDRYNYEPCCGAVDYFRNATPEEIDQLNQAIPDEESYPIRKDLTGRYLMALVDEPCGGIVGKNEYALIENKNWVDFPSQSHYGYSPFYEGEYIGKLKVLPKGCNPIAVTKEEEVVVKGEMVNGVTKLKKGEYIVLTSCYRGNNSWKNSIPESYCYKLRENSTYPEFNIELDIDNIPNGWNGYNKDYGGKVKFRYATGEEIAEYDRLGEPYDVTTLSKKEYKGEVVHVKNKEEFDIVKSKCNKNSPLYNTFWENCEYYPEGMAISVEEGLYSRLNWWKENNYNYKIISFEEFCIIDNMRTLESMKNQEDLKIGDWVEIVNLDDGEGGTFLGKIGHQGKVVSISCMGYYTLEPYCIGDCWLKKNLVKIPNPVESEGYEWDTKIMNVTDSISSKNKIVLKEIKKNKPTKLENITIKTTKGKEIYLPIGVKEPKRIEKVLIKRKEISFVF